MRKTHLNKLLKSFETISLTHHSNYNNNKAAHAKKNKSILFLKHFRSSLTFIWVAIRLFVLFHVDHRSLEKAYLYIFRKNIICFVSNNSR